ncbi:hypothetical protein FQN50_009910 [Emmonsiellopsis sp. PD_5]|nr:hypothetical protein FQN50_009910 [Emmonsiellopsis sp. PD_5]
MTVDIIDYVFEFDYRLFNYERANMTTIGLTPDSVAANAKFKTGKDIHFTLLSDPQKKLLNAVGLRHISKTDKKMKTVGVFVVDTGGTLLFVKSGKPDMVLNALDRKMYNEIILATDEEDDQPEESEEA